MERIAFLLLHSSHDIFWDLGSLPPKKLCGFPQDDLERYTYPAKRSLSAIYQYKIAGRDYKLAK
jgi:hypothetical protein